MRALLLALLGGAALAAAEDPRLLAAEASLAEGQPDRAVALLRDLPASRAAGRERLCLVRAQWALGDPRTALLTLDEGAAGDCAPWPSALRSAAARLAGGLHVALGEPERARAALAVARAHGDDDLGTLALAAELAAAAGDGPEAQRLAGAGWRRMPRGAASAGCGLILARLAAGSDPTAARTILADLRALAELPRAQRVAAAELLCRLLLPAQPGQCLVVAEREITGSADGTLPRWRALALAALSAEEATAELAALPAALRDDPAVRAAEEGLQAARAAGRQADAGQRIERATAAAELGRWDQVVALVSADAQRDPAALILLARCPQADAEALLAAPAARDQRAALALARALALGGRAASAWRAVQPALAAAEQGGDAAGFIWAAEALRSSDPLRAAGLLQRAVAARPPPGEVGIAWARLAETDEAGGQTSARWLVAAETLPVGHPWFLAAAARAGRGALADDGDLARAGAVLARVPMTETSAEALRCRFLRAQILARQGRQDEARTLASGLLPLADEAQRARVQGFLAGLGPDQNHPGDTP